jgi:hypothetical protein
MKAKDKAEANQIFRQFAWNLAGTLAGARTTARRPAGRSGKAGSRRA